MKKLKIISLAVLALSLNSCRKDSPYVAPVIPPPANLSFATDVYPILTTYSCKNCHSGSTAPKLSTAALAFSALTATGTNFVKTDDPSASSFYISVTTAAGTNQMPKGSTTKLTANEQATILAWITQGAHE
jgi:uncharacterized membrane protein